MDLGTFGAILSFAMDLERRAVAFHGSNGEVAMAQAAERRLRLLEQARREGVAEMILESIDGLDGTIYASPLKTREDLAQFGSSCARFYGDAAAKIPIREVVRLFQRLATEHDCSSRGASG